MPSIKDIVKGYTVDDQGNKTPVDPKVFAKVLVKVDDVRGNLRDYPRFNEINRYELTDDEIADCIIDAVAIFNAEPPFMSDYSPMEFPDRKLLQDLSVGECLDRLVNWHARNQFSADDSGVQVPIHEQWQPIMQIAKTEEARNDKRMARLKAQLNIQRGWGGGVGSPLWMG